MDSRSNKTRRLFHSPNADPAPRRLSQTVRSLGLRRPLRVEPLEERRLLATGLSGIVFEDFNGDGVFGAAESPLSGWTVELDGTGMSTQTDAAGAYDFTVPAPGTFDVRLDLLAGYRQTLPAGGTMQTVTLNLDEQVTDINFGAQLNTPATARNDEYTVSRDAAFSINAAGGVLSNDVDTNGDVLTASIGVIPAHGSLALSPDGSFVYTPDQYYVGLDSFTYTANDGLADSEVATVALEIVQPGVNTRASDDLYTMELGGTLDVGLINGNFELGDLTAWTVYTTPGGTLGGAGFPDVISYDTNNDRVATESFQAMVGNGGGGIYQNVYLNAGNVRVSAEVAVDSQVDHAEAGLFELLVDGTVVASYDFGDITADEPEHITLAGQTTVAPGEHEVRVRITRSSGSAFGSTPFGFVDNVSVYGATGSVLSNDPAAATASVAQLVTSPKHGSLDFEPDGSFRYVPDAAFSGEDTFVYKNAQPGKGLTLYTVDNVSDKLLKMDSVTAQLSVVGAIEHDMFEVDMTYLDGVLYALNMSGGSGELVTIDPVTGKMIATVPISGNITAVKGLTAVDGELYVMFNVPNSGSTSTHGSILGRLDPATGEIAGLANYRSLTGFNWDMDALWSDAPGRILGGWLYWQTISVYDLNYDPAGINLLGRAYPPPGGTDNGPPLNDGTSAGADQFVLRSTTQYLHRLNPYADGYDVTLDDVDLSPTGDTLSGLAYAPEFETNTATVTISVTVPPPTATDDTYTTDEDTTLVVDAATGLLDNDTDPQSEPLEAVLLDPPQNGSLLLSADGSFTYVPDDDFFGPDTFTYVANNGSSDSTPATVTITVDPVNDAPVAVDDDFYSVIEFETLTVDVAGGVLANDTDTEDDPLEAILDVGPANGTLQLNPDGSFVYTPDSTGFLGFDTFTYLANDGTDDSNIATVSIEVIERTAPFAIDDGVYTVAEEETLTVDVATGVLFNDSDPQGDTITAVLDIGPQHGTLQLDPEGSFTYTSDDDYVGPDSFTYTSNDGTENSEVATVTLEVTPVDDPTIAVDDDYVIDEDTTLVVNVAQGLLDNDIEVDGDPLEAILDVDVEHGTLLLAPNGSFSYRADEHYYGPDSFTYHVNDGVSDSNIATVNITVNSVNDAPVAVGDGIYEIEEDELLTVDVTTGVLDNDSDVEDDPLSAVLDVGPQHGTLLLDPDGSFVYDSDDDYFGPDSFTYVANDGADDSNVVTVDIEVLPVNDAPVAVDDGDYLVGQDAVLTVAVADGVLPNDSDVENDPLTAAVDVDPANGIVQLSDDGSFVYTPGPGFAGVDTFTYVANDGELDSPAATLTIIVNDPPESQPDGYVAYRSGTLNVTADLGLLANDTDKNGNPLTATLVDAPTFGTVRIALDGSFTYEPMASYLGTDTFTYRAEDEFGMGDEAVVTIEVKLPPVESNAAGDSLHLFTDTALGAGPVEGRFDSGDLDGWTPFTVGGGTLGGVGFPAVHLFDTNNDGAMSAAAQFLAGDGGGGISRWVPLVGGSAVITADVAIDAFLASDEGGRFELLLDGAVVASYDFGPVDADRDYADLRAEVPSVSPGQHEIAVRIVRQGPSGFGESPLGYVDNVMIYDGSPSVLSNDDAAPAEGARAMLVSGPQNGTLDLRPDGTFHYIPDPGFEGVDTFRYKRTVASEGLTLYTIDTASDELIAIDSGTGAHTVVGPIGYDMFQSNLAYMNGSIWAVTDNDGDVYNDSGQTLVSIDPLTGSMSSAVAITDTPAVIAFEEIYSADMDTDPGWTLDLGAAPDQWQWGTPTGGGGQYGNADPPAGHTGSNVVGYNLSGDYPNSISSTQWITTPAIDASAYSNVQLEFYRWLNVEQPAFDHAYIEVSNDGSNWSQIWRNPSEITDSSWTLQTFDISSIADQQATVYIRWGIGSTDGSWQYSGWNIDDVVVTADVGTSGTDFQWAEALTASDGILYMGYNSNAIGQLDPVTGKITDVVNFEGADIDGLATSADGRMVGFDRTDFAGVIRQLEFFEVDNVTGTSEVLGDYLVENVHDASLEFTPTASWMLYSDAHQLYAGSADNPVDVAGMLALSPASANYSGLVFTPDFESNLAEVTLNVVSTDELVAVDDVYETWLGQPLVVSAGDGVTANDLNFAQSQLAMTVVDGPLHGLLLPETDGSFSYIPDAGFTGADSFTYTISDSTGTSNVATVAIAVGAERFQQIVGTSGADVFVFRPGPTVASWIVTVNGEVRDIDPAVTAVHLEGGGGNDVAFLYDSPGDDLLVVNENFGRMTGGLPGESFAVQANDFRYVHGFSTAGGTDTAKLYGTAGEDTVVTRPTDAKLAGAEHFGRAWYFDAATMYGGGGGDRAVLYDSASQDVLRASPTNTTFSGDLFDYQILGVGSLTAHATGGDDVAFLYDSPGDDTLVVDDTHGSLTGGLPGQTFALTVYGFRYAHGFSKAGGTDTAELYGTAGKDTVVTRPTDAKIIGTKHFGRAWYFDAVTVQGGGGDDRAVLYDSAAQDILRASPTETTFSSSGLFDYEILGVGSLQAFSTGGNDVAFLYDSPGNDLLVVDDTYGSLTGGTFSLTANDFRYVHGYSTAGGTDTAELYGTAGTDTVVTRLTDVKLLGAGHFGRAWYFDQVIANGGGGDDVAVVYEPEHLDSGFKPLPASGLGQYYWLWDLEDYTVVKGSTTHFNAVDAVYTAYWD